MMKKMKVIRLWRLLLGICILSYLPEYSVAGEPPKNKPVIIERQFQDKSVVRIQFLTENILRIRIAPGGGDFKESGLNRYGFINEFENIPAVDISESKKYFSARTSSFRLKGNATNGELLITDATGKTVLLNQTSFSFEEGFSKVNFQASQTEDWVGFGDQTRKRLYHRGYEADCYVRDVRSYIPVPFFMSTLGVGVMVNTTNHITFDMCKNDPNMYSWKNYGGTIDYYIMIGDGYNQLIDLYTDLTGKPKLPPEWSFGLWYICRTHADDREVMSDALNFRREEIPCNVIGLEPGWMGKNYDYSTDKEWSKERFPIPEYAFNGPSNFINALKRMGYNLELWLCNDYDLTCEEERLITEKEKTGHDVKTVSDNNEKFEVDEHLSHPVYFDKITKRDEAWFEHLEKFVDQGVDFFKQDAANQVLDHPDRLWCNGMSDKEMHNLYPLLYSRQMYEGFKEHTNRRPLVFTPCGWLGFQAWSGTWTGDTGGKLGSLGALLNTSMVGHSWSTTDMEVAQKEGIHFGYLQPWSQINSWNYFRMPWLQGSELSEMHRYYSQLRMRLIPYIYSWAYFATQTGFPLLRPLTLEFPEDNACRNNLHQYLLGRDLMVGVYKKEMYFPEGMWKDYWTGQVVSGSQTAEISWPENRGGALYVRSGAIIPIGPAMQYWGERPTKEMSLYVFPDTSVSEFEFYEDDGVTLENLDGKYSITKISAKAGNGESTIQINESKGNFDGKVEDRTWNVIVHQDKIPGSVWVNGVSISKENYVWDKNRQEITITGIVSPAVVRITL